LTSKIKAYQDILNTLENNLDVIKGDCPLDIRDQLKERIKLVELSELFGIEIKDKSGRWEWIQLSEHQVIALMGTKHERTIAWSDDDKQPIDEWLYVVRFPTGPYTFGQDCPVNTFKKFFNELSEFGPKYRDTFNKCLYFDHHRAKDVHERFWSIYQKHKESVSVELKQVKIENLKRKLAELEGE
jgi:hypothetical protein